MISFPVRLSEKQHQYLKEIKRTHGISMAASIRNLIMRDMFGIGGQSVSRRVESGKKTRPVRTGNVAYSACMRELSQVFAIRKRGGRG